jgi:hypothetical protein
VHDRDGDTPPHGYETVRTGDTPPRGTPTVQPTGPWKVCPHCSAQAQTLGSFCPFCGGSYVRHSNALPPPPSARAAADPVGIGIALLAAATMFISIFLPLAESTRTFGTVSQNTLIQSGPGVGYLVAALLIGGLAYAAVRGNRRVGWGIAAIGALVLISAILYSTASDALVLYPLDETGEPDASSEGERANPGIGLYVAGVGGLIAVWGGLQVALTRRASA